MNPRKADVSLMYNGTNATGQISSYLNSFEYTDQAAGTSDSISITVNDRDHKWIGSWFPVKGDKLQPTIIVQNWNKSGDRLSLPCGLFTVDDFSFSGGPIRLKIDAVALPASTSFKTESITETYEKTSIKEIGEKIAGRAGIALYFEATDISIEKVEQNNQNDCEFFTGLVEKYGLALKIYNNKLVVFSEADYESKPAKYVLTPADFDPSWSWDTKLDGTYTGVNYQYTNSEKNKTFTVNAGTTERVLTCNEPADNMTEATAIALAAVNNANKDTTTMSISLMARPGLIASDCVQISGLKKLDGKYYIVSIRHSVGSGYKMTLELRKVIARISETKNQSSTVEESSKEASGDTGGSSEKPDESSGELKVGEQYTLTEKKVGYYTAAEAAAEKVADGHPSGTVGPGTYWIYNMSQGMLNLTTAKSVPGSWVNPG